MALGPLHHDHSARLRRHPAGHGEGILRDLFAAHAPKAGHLARVRRKDQPARERANPGIAIVEAGHRRRIEDEGNSGALHKSKGERARRAGVHHARPHNHRIDTIKVLLKP